MKKIKHRIESKTGELKTVIKINPNTFLYGDDRYIDNFRDFKQAMKAIKKSCIHEDYTISRIDFRIDDYSNNYSDFFKINKIVLLCLAKKLNICDTGIWQSSAPIKQYNKSLRAQNAYYEIEYYNRLDKTRKDGLTHTRLELRNKGVKCSIKDIPTLIKQWKDLLNIIPDSYKELQAEYNNALVELWQQERTTDLTMNMYKFIEKHKENICTSNQLQELLYSLGANNPKELAYRYAYLADIELISETELKKYVRELINALIKFRGKV